MSFYTSLTGLNGAQADIATISNNVANVGTTGFKRARAEFGDIFATSPLQNAGSAVGSGTILKSVKQQFTQGNIQSSLNALDLAITGQGFFAMKPSLTSSQTVYTRNGSFSVNNDRYVVDSKGQYLQVFPVNDDGSVIATGIDSARNLQLPVNSGLPQATTKIELGLNLPADAEIIPNNPKYTESNPYAFNKDDASTFNRSTSITIYDSLGNPTIATIYYVKTSNATEASPTNKWQTYVYVGDNELDPALITAKDEQGQTLYINKFGQVTSDPASVDSAFQPGAPHPLYKLDQQDIKEPSSPSKVVGAIMKNIGFDFGDTDSNRVQIITDPDDYASTKEGGATESNPPFWGKNMFTIAVDGSEPVSVSINAGSYTGTELAAEMTRAVNEAFGDDKYIKITDSYQRSGGTVVSGNDIIQLNLFKLDEDGNPQGLSTPIELDLLGSAGSAGTDIDGAGAVAPNRDLELTREELIELVQKKLNEQMNDRFADLGKSNASWVDDADETTWPITVGYDVAKRALTFTANRNLIGPNASELSARFNSFQVFVPEDPVAGSSLGIPLRSTSPDTLIRAGTQWVGNDLVPDGEYILDPLDQRFGITVTYNKDSRQFSFVSGKTGESSSVSVGRASLNATPVAQKDSYDFTNESLAAGDVASIEIGGKSVAFTNGTGAALSGAALVTAIVDQVASEVQTLALTGPVTTSGTITIGGVSVSVAASDTASTVAAAVKSALEASSDFNGASGRTVTVSGASVVIRYAPSEYDPDPVAFSFASTGVGGTLTTQARMADILGPDFTISKSGAKLLLTGSEDGNQFVSTVRLDGTVKSIEAIGAGGSVAGVTVGSADFGATDESPFDGGTNYLLGIGAGLNTLTVDGKGLASTSATVTGNRAIVPLNQTFVLNETLGENVMTFTVDGIVGTITLPIRAYTGETFAAAIQERVNQIEDPTTGRTVSGVTVRFDPDNNRLIFTSGTTGSSSQINVVGHPNFGLRNVTQTRGEVPIITNLEQAKDAEGNLLYIDETGEIVTQKPDTLQNWFPLYLDQGELTFDTFGKLISPKEGVVYSPFDPSNGSDLIRLNIDYGKFSTQYSQPFSVLSLTQDGFPSGRLDGLDIDASGTVRANYTNGQTKALGKIILANFNNPNGLKQVGNANYVATSVSGDSLLGEAGSDGFGTVQSGSLERSNVDITEELVNLITAQRNFQANAKAIETTTTLTNTIIQIRG
jgi:flagellar hook-basal body protein